MLFSFVAAAVAAAAAAADRGLSDNITDADERVIGCLRTSVPPFVIAELSRRDGLEHRVEERSVNAESVSMWDDRNTY